jgi:uncharacterized membrane protein YidH (DUF202 family)
MFSLKKLKSAKEPRLYLSIERTFLSFQRLAIFLVSLAIFLWKLRRIAVEIKGTHLSPIWETLFKFFFVFWDTHIPFVNTKHHVDVKIPRGGRRSGPKRLFSS